jgi:hypothetical protein
LAPLLPRLQLLTLSRMELMTASQFMFKVRGRRRLALLLSPIYHSIPPVLGRAFVCVRVCVCVCVFIYACLVMLHECAFFVPHTPIHIVPSYSDTTCVLVSGRRFCAFSKSILVFEK